MQVLGIVDIIWRGQNIPVEKGATLQLGGIKNNIVVYGRKVARAREFQPSKITATTHLERGRRWKDQYDADTEGELVVICDTAQTFTWPDAFLSDDIPEMTGGEGGKIKLQWSGGDYQEVIAA